MKYQIKRKGVVVVEVEPAGKQDRRAMGVNVVDIEFSLLSPVEILQGDTIMIYGEQYFFPIAKADKTKDTSSLLWKYKLQFVHNYYKFTNYPYNTRNKDNKLLVPNFSFTGDLAAHFSLFMQNLNEYETGWMAGVIDSTEIRTISYADNNLLNVLNKWVEVFKTEYWIENKTIHLTKRTGSSGIVLAYGKGNGLVSLNQKVKDNRSIFTRLIAQGGNTNLPVDYGYQNLQLPAATNGYIEDAVKVAKYGTIVATKTFDDIIPERIGIISQVGDKFTFYDASINFDVSAYRLPGITPKVGFQTGMLAGLQFQIENYDHATKKITIGLNEDEKVVNLPNDTIKPAVGDKYSLFYISLPNEYVTDAQNRLLTAASEYYNAGSDENYSDEFTVECDKYYFQRNNTNPILGYTVNLTNPAPLLINVDKRVSGIKRDIQDVWDYELTVTDDIDITQTARSFLQQDKIYSLFATSSKGDITTGSQSFLGQLSGNNGYLYIAGVKAKAGFADVAQDAIHAYTADYADLSGIARKVISADFVSGFAGTGHRLVDGVLEADNVIVRKSLEAYSLNIREITGSGGSHVVTNVAKVKSVTGSGPYVCEFDTDGGTIYNPFQIDDIVRCQIWDSTKAKYYAARVIAVTASTFTISIIEGFGIPAPNDKLFQFDNYTNPDRKGLIYLTNSDTGAPYLDVTYGFYTNPSTKTKVRLGKLDGIYDPAFGGWLSGYGAYLENIRAKGTIIVAEGSNVYTKTETDNAINDAVSELEVIADDGVLTPKDKILLKLRYDSVANEVEDIKASAALVGADSTAYNTSFYTVLYPYVYPLISNMGSTSTVDGALLTQYFRDYYIQKSLLEKSIQQFQKNNTDKKNTNFLSQPSNYIAGDTWTLQSDLTLNGIFYKKGEELTTQTASVGFVSIHWAKLNPWTDDSAVEEIKTQIGEEFFGDTIYSTNSFVGFNYQEGILQNSNSLDRNNVTRASQIFISGTMWDMYKAQFVTTGKLYTLSFWLKLGTATNLVVVLNPTLSWQPHVAEKIITGAGWQQVNITFVAPSSGAVNVHIGGNDTLPQSAGTIFISDYEIREKITISGAIEDVLNKTAKLVTLTGATQIISVSKTGTNIPASPFTVVGVAQNTTITEWAYSIDGGSWSTTLPAGVSRLGDIVTINPATVTFKNLSIRASDGTYSDTFTVARAIDGVDGVDGKGIAIKDSKETYAELPTTGLTAGDAYFVKADGLLYIYDGTSFPPSGSGILFQGESGKDGYTILLGNQSHTFAGSETAAIASSTTCDVITYKGSSPVGASITVGTLPTGLTASVSGSIITFTASTALTTSGTVDITIVVDGITFVEKFSYTISFKGVTGKSITNVDVEFSKSSSATIAPAGGWQTLNPGWEQGYFIWTRTKTTYSDNTTTYSAAFNPTGSDGRGISSMTEEYYLSTSKTTPTGGMWQATPPTWEQGKYLATRVKIVYSNPASTEYTEPVFSSEWEAVNNIKIGGKNLLKDSSFENGWLATYGHYSLGASIGNADIDGRPVPDGSKCLATATFISPGNSVDVDHYLFLNDPILIKTNTEYVLSFMHSSGGAIVRSSSYLYFDNVPTLHLPVNYQPGAGWKQYEFKFTTPANVEYLRMRLGFITDGTNNGWACFDALQLEEGNIKSPFSISQRDLVDEIASFSVDSILKPTEKQTLKLRMSEIDKDHTGLLSRAGLYGASTTLLATYYSQLTSYINPLLSSMTTDSTIVRTQFDGYFNNYFNERKSVETIIETAAKSNTDKKSTVFNVIGGTSTPYKPGDRLIPSITQSNEGVTFTAGKVYVTKTASNYWINSHWSLDDSEEAKILAQQAVKFIDGDRQSNRTPQWYLDNYPSQERKEFKELSYIGLLGAGTWGGLITKIPYIDSSAGYVLISQTVVTNNKTYTRSATSATTWGTWSSPEDAIANLNSQASSQQLAINDVKNKTSAVTYIGAGVVNTGVMMVGDGTTNTGFISGVIDASWNSVILGVDPGGYANKNNAKFRVTLDGRLTATDATIVGNITATSGTFTGTVNATSGVFNNVNIQSGTISGFTISNNLIYNTSNDPTVGKGVSLDSSGLFAFKSEDNIQAERISIYSQSNARTIFVTRSRTEGTGSVYAAAINITSMTVDTNGVRVDSGQEIAAQIDGGINLLSIRNSNNTASMNGSVRVYRSSGINYLVLV